MAGASAEIVLAVDVGTGSTRVTAYDLNGTLVATTEAEYPTYYERPGWAEQEPEDWWSAAQAALRDSVAQLGGSYVIKGIGLTGQSPSIAPFAEDGRPLRRGLIYQDNRALVEAQEWKERLGGAESVHRRTGHDPAAFYIGPKVLWVQRHEPAIFARTALWMQPRDVVAWRLTGQAATDWSHAGSTLLFDIATRTWASDLFTSQGISPAQFPSVLAPWSVLGEVVPTVAAALRLPRGVPVVLGGADSQCCVVGAGVLNAHQLSDMAGTSTCLNAPVRQPLSDLRVANYCHVVPDYWCTELGLNASGAAFEWLATLLAPAGTLPLFEACEAAAREAEAGAAGLIFLPYLADGERFNPALRGAFCDLSLRHGRGELARAILEGVAYAIRQHLEIMTEAGAPTREIHVSGGGARVEHWNQIKADVTGVPIVSVASDATSLGVALVAAAALKLYPSLEAAVARCVKLNRRYEPDVRLKDLYTERYTRFRYLAQATAEKPETHKGSHYM